MILTLSNEKIGTPSVLEDWNEEKEILVTYKELFLKGLNNSVKNKRNKPKDIKELLAAADARDTGISLDGVKNTLQYRCDNLDPNTQHYHLNYMGYLYKCWDDHLGVTITPDILWYTLLCEVAEMVNVTPDKFHNLFTTSDKVEEIIVPSGDIVIMPLDILSKALKNKVPTDTEVFFPEFSTRTPRSWHAFQAAFCDMCSPFYIYSMYLCNIPKVDVRGTLDDWKFLSDKWNGLAKIIGVNIWTEKVSAILNMLVEKFQNKDFWKNIFSIEHCGSGGQIEVYGWFADFFREQPRVKYVENYSPHVSVVKYKQSNFNKKYEMYVGMFGSKMQNEFLVPEFSFVVNEDLRTMN
jgi:hypothetical protein